MCTASWIQDTDRLTLFFNRDERRDRPDGLPPQVSEKGGVRVIAPRDRLAGGTWLFANEAGCTAALLNHYPEYPTAPDDRPEKWTSRGSLLFDLADCRRTEKAENILRERLFSTCFKPFHLLWFAPGNERTMWTWDGNTLAGPTPPSPPVTTSAWNPGEVRRERLRLFAERIGDWETAGPEDLEACHLATSPRGSSFGVLMDREDSCTVSLCRVDIDPARVRMTYLPRLAGGRFGSSRTTEIPRTIKRAPPTHPQRRISSCP